MSDIDHYIKYGVQGNQTTSTNAPTPVKRTQTLHSKPNKHKCTNNDSNIKVNNTNSTDESLVSAAASPDSNNLSDALGNTDIQRILAQSTTIGSKKTSSRSTPRQSSDSAISLPASINTSIRAAESVQSTASHNKDASSNQYSANAIFRDEHRPTLSEIARYALQTAVQPSSQPHYQYRTINPHSNQHPNTTINTADNTNNNNTSISVDSVQPFTSSQASSSSPYFVDDSRPTLNEVLNYAIQTSQFGHTMNKLKSSLYTTIAPRTSLLSSRLGDPNISVTDRLSVLQPCDLILVRTPGHMYSILRQLANQQFDHLAIVMNDKHVLHISPPTIRLLHISTLIQPNRSPIVLRPKLSESEKQTLLESLNTLIGQQYDTISVIKFVSKLILNKYISHSSHPIDYTSIKRVSNDMSTNRMLNNTYNTGSSNKRTVRMICTDAIIDRLSKTNPKFASIRNSQLSSTSQQSTDSYTLSDVLQLYQRRLVDLVVLPPAIDKKTGKPLTQYQSRKKQIKKTWNKTKFQLLMYYMNNVSDSNKEYIGHVYELCNSAINQSMTGVIHLITPTRTDIISFIKSSRKRKFLATYLVVRRYLPFKYMILSSIAMLYVILEATIRSKLASRINSNL